MADYRATVHILGLEAKQLYPQDYPFLGPVEARISLIVRTQQRRDQDNLMASLKPGWDGLVDAGVLKYDHIGYLQLVFDGVYVVPELKPHVRVVLSALP